MAYNIHFINKRKSMKIHQINSSARMSPTNEDTDFVQETIFNKQIINEARKTGVLSVVQVGLLEIPTEVYHINRPDDRRNHYEGFDNDEKNSWWEDVLLTRLDLSSNRISFISDDIRFLSHLLYVDLEDNDLCSIPDCVGELSQLQYLNISGNKITSLPESIGTLNQLQHLLVRKNLLKNLPTEFCRLLSLEVLDLSNNEFTCLPEFLGNFIRLKRLSLSGNSIRELPGSICQLTVLTVVDMSRNKLAVFPRALESPVEILRLDVNFLSEFPVYRMSPCLKELYVDNNCIGGVSSAQIEFVPNICVLSMAKNGVRELPNEIVELPCLRLLDISFNSLQSIPYALGNMDQLRVLCVDGNPLRSINRSAITSGTEALKRYLRTRTSSDWSATRTVLTPAPAPAIAPAPAQLDDSVSSASAIAAGLQTNGNNDECSIDAQELNCAGTVDLANRGLHAIPGSYFERLRCKQIRAVLLPNNMLTQFPVGLVPFAATIARLDLSNNRLLELPNVLHDFLALTHLNLNGNYLRTLPDSLGALSKCLLSLQLARNPLGMELPAIVFELTSLQYLNASHCAVVTVNAANFLKLTQLEELDLSDNEIEVIPPTLGLCEHIKTLHLDRNRIRHPSIAAALHHGTQIVLEYLRSQIQ